MAAATALGAWSLRRMLLPGWSGSRGRLVEAILGLGLVIGGAELLGIVGILDKLPLAVALVAAGVGAAALERRRGGRPPSESGRPETPQIGPWQRPAAVGIGVLFAAHWGGRVLD